MRRTCNWCFGHSFCSISLDDKDLNQLLLNYHIKIFVKLIRMHIACIILQLLIETVCILNRAYYDFVNLTYWFHAISMYFRCKVFYQSSVYRNCQCKTIVFHSTFDNSSSLFCLFSWFSLNFVINAHHMINSICYLMSSCILSPLEKHVIYSYHSMPLHEHNCDVPKKMF